MAELLHDTAAHLAAGALGLAVAGCDACFGKQLGTPIRVDARPPGQVRFTCPDCLRTSYHPTDALEGFCGYCHDWTGVSS